MCINTEGGGGGGKVNMCVLCIDTEEGGGGGGKVNMCALCIDTGDGGGGGGIGNGGGRLIITCYITTADWCS